MDPVTESAAQAHGPAAVPAPPRRRVHLVRQIRDLVRAIDDGDDAQVESAVLQLSRTRRYLAPLAFLVGAFVMLFQGLRLLVANWRLTLIQIIPAMWIWVVTLDLKLHLFKGREMRLWYGADSTGLGHHYHPDHGGQLLLERGVRLRDLASG